MSASSFYLLKEHFQAADNRESRALAVASKNVAATAAAGVAGAKVLDHTRFIEDAQPIPQTTSSFSIEEGNFEFKKSFDDTPLSTTTIIKNALDTDWQRANEWHPISWMMLHSQAVASIVAAMKAKPPLIKFCRGKQNAYLTVGGDKAYQAKLLASVGFSTSEITAMLAVI